LTDTIKEKEQAKQIIVKPDKENLPSNNVLLPNGYIFDKKKDYYYKLLD
jgi:predicted acetyltransferase